MTARFAPVVLIPVFDHDQAVGAMTASVVATGVPCLLIDDGSGPDCARTLDALHSASGGSVALLRLPRNEGKGAAVMAGMAEAARLGYTHAVQIDADGQHDATDIPRFLECARHSPGVVVCGTPVFDASVPRARLYGRWLTHVWVWINTLSLAIADSMCGFRVYPLAPTLKLIAEEPVGRRMDFDIEILVRLYWRGIGVMNLPTRVTYHPDGISHFRVWRDNVRISRAHARLFLGMLRRLPVLLPRIGTGA